jgi:hypothetical protein
MAHAEMMRLAFENPSNFIKLATKCEIKDLTKYKGFEATHEKMVILNSGR